VLIEQFLLGTNFFVDGGHAAPFFC